jgi:hypothetical protein
MTRRSKRELERAVEDLGGDADTVREWAEHYLDRLLAEEGFDFRFTAPAGEEPVPIFEDRDGFIYSVPAADIPDWIDHEDLPVEP